MNTHDTPLLPHGGYRKLRSYPDEIRRYEDSGRRNFSLRASGSSTGICIAASRGARLRCALLVMASHGAPLLYDINALRYRQPP